jgi:hypothetical protein
MKNRNLGEIAEEWERHGERGVQDTGGRVCVSERRVKEREKTDAM